MLTSLSSWNFILPGCVICWQVLHLWMEMNSCWVPHWPCCPDGPSKVASPPNHSNCHKTLLSQKCCMLCKVMYSVAHGSLGEDSALHFVEVLQNLDFPVPCFVTCPFLSSHQCLVDLRSVYRNMCGLGMLPTMESIPPQPAHWSSFFSCF